MWQHAQVRILQAAVNIIQRCFGRVVKATACYRFVHAIVFALFPKDDIPLGHTSTYSPLFYYVCNHNLLLFFHHTASLPARRTSIRSCIHAHGSRNSDPLFTNRNANRDFAPIGANFLGSEASRSRHVHV